MQVIVGLVALFIVVTVLTAAVNILGAAVGLALDLAGLFLKALPIIAVVLVIAFFVQGGRIRRDGSSYRIDLPEGWRRH